jgi:hypothetical protein
MTIVDAVYVCEIKFSKQPIGRAVIPEVSFRPILIHVNGVEQQVLDDRYFDAVIDFSELWR